jgi:site-specific DNA-methyltransferase (cytosine-N4-specific)
MSNAVTDTPEPTLGEFFAHIGEAKDKRTLTHGLHPYPAKFIPHIPRRLITQYSRPGSVVMDPMNGSGTTVVEAAVLGRPAIGVDVNPIACLAASAKTARLSDAERRELGALVARLRRGDLDFGVPLPPFHNRAHWFSDHVSEELAACVAAIDETTTGSARVVSRACLSAIVVGASNQESETRWAAKHNPILRGEVARRLANRLEESENRLAALEAETPAPVTVVRADARSLPLRDDSVDLVVTSPPYANSHDYYLYNKLRMFWLGYDVASVQSAEIGSRNKHSDKKLEIDHYDESMQFVVNEMARVLKPGGFTAIVVADAVVRGTFFDMGERFEGFLSRSGLVLREHVMFGHRDFNSTFQRGFGTTHEKLTHVLVGQAPGPSRLNT